MKILMMATLVMAYGHSARAERIDALKISSDYFPNTTYELGFDLTSDRLIEDVYLSDGQSETTVFGLEELKSQYTDVFDRYGFHFVKLKIVEMDSHSSGTIELSVLRNVITGRRKSILFDVKLGSSGRYQVTDLRNGKHLNHLMIQTNYKAGIPIGIRDIQEMEK